MNSLMFLLLKLFHIEYKGVHIIIVQRSKDNDNNNKIDAKHMHTREQSHIFIEQTIEDGYEME